MKLRVRRTGCIAVGLILFGLLLPVVYAHWLETGSIAPLDMPFSVTAMVSFGLGLFAFFIKRRVVRHAPRQNTVVIPESPEHKHFRQLRHLPLKPRISDLPSFGLLYVLMLTSVLIPSFLIFLYAWGFNLRSVGIEVHLLNPGPRPARGNLWTAPLIVRLENAGSNSPPRLYLNSRAVPWEALGTTLKGELKSRSDWVVYFETDRNVDWKDDVAWGDVANAMDIARGLGAKVAFLPKELASPPRNRQGAQPRK